jgi:hypothetical protein
MSCCQHSIHPLTGAGVNRRICTLSSAGNVDCHAALRAKVADAEHLLPPFSIAVVHSTAIKHSFASKTSLQKLVQTTTPALKHTRTHAHTHTHTHTYGSGAASAAYSENRHPNHPPHHTTPQPEMRPRIQQGSYATIPAPGDFPASVHV